MHIEAEGFVVAVDVGPGLGWAASSWCADSGDEGGDELAAGGQERGDVACGVAGYVVAAGAAGFGDVLFAAQFAQVVGALAGAVVLGGLSGHRPQLGGELGGGEPCRGDR